MLPVERIVAGVALLVALGVTAVGLWQRGSHAVEVATLERNLGYARSEAANLRTAVAEQNAGAQRLAFETQALQQQLRLADARRGQEVILLSQRLQELSRAEIPADCPGAMLWAAQQGRRLSQW